MNRQMSQTIWYSIFGGYGSLEPLATSWTNLVKLSCSWASMHPSLLWARKRLTFVQFTLFKTPPTLTIGNFTLRTRCQSSKYAYCSLIFTSGRLRYFSVLFSRQNSFSSIVSGKQNLPSAMAKTICNYLKFITPLGYKFGAMQNCWIIKNKSS